jgi:hypothetical protein
MMGEGKYGDELGNGKGGRMNCEKWEEIKIGEGKRGTQYRER